MVGRLVPAAYAAACELTHRSLLTQPWNVRNRLNPPSPCHAILLPPI